MSAITTQTPATFETMRVVQLKPHPKNVRATAVADAEMVASVAAHGIHQPLVVAPHPTLDGDYTVIMGHRRLDAAKKAGLDVVPVLVRHDLLTEQAQIAAMVQENLHRQDLTVVEEADAVQAMLAFDGWDAKRVAAETGLSARRVKARAKLTRLGEDQRTALAAGQLTLERAMVLADFVGTDQEQDLLAVAGTPETSWEWHLKRAKEARAWAKRRPAVVNEHEAAGVPVVPAPEIPTWRNDCPWQPAKFETPQEAATAGASVIVSDTSDDVQYVLPRAVPAPGEVSAADEARAARKALTDELDAELATVSAVEDEWIRGTVLPAAARGDERTLRVIARHYQDATQAYGAYWELHERQARILGLPNTNLTAPDRKAQVASALAGRALTELAALFVLAMLRPRGLGHRAYEVPSDATLVWFELRQALGWEWLDPETRAVHELGGDEGPDDRLAAAGGIAVPAEAGEAA